MVIQSGFGLLISWPSKFVLLMFHLERIGDLISRGQQKVEI